MSYARHALRVLTLLGLASLVGCASTLPYTPAQQPKGYSISADYFEFTDAVRVEVDTDGYTLQGATIVRDDGSRVRPMDAEETYVYRYSPTYYPYNRWPYYDHWGGYRSGWNVGFGGGTGCYYGGVGWHGSTYVTRGHTYVWFNREAIGPPPWTLVINVRGTEPVNIDLPER